jgi:hypothetical protein
MATATLEHRAHTARPTAYAEHTSHASAVRVAALTDAQADVQLSKAALYLVSILFVTMFLIVPMFMLLVGNVGH